MKHAIALLAFAALVGCASSGDYKEHRKDGRIYVTGSKESSESFKKSGHMPYTRTLIGAGPNRETVVFEVDKKDESLADRLEAEFRKRHGLPEE